MLLARQLEVLPASRRFHNLIVRRPIDSVVQVPEKQNVIVVEHLRAVCCQASGVRGKQAPLAALVLSRSLASSPSLASLWLPAQARTGKRPWPHAADLGSAATPLPLLLLHLLPPLLLLLRRRRRPIQEPHS